MSCNCGKCCNCCNKCKSSNKPCNGCSSEYINGLNQEYLQLDADYNENADEAIAANEALIEAMEDIVDIDNAQNCIVEDIEGCIGAYDSFAKNLVKQLNCASEELSNLYGAILKNARENEKLLYEMVETGNEYNEILDKLVRYLAQYKQIKTRLQIGLFNIDLSTVFLYLTNKLLYTTKKNKYIESSASKGKIKNKNNKIMLTYLILICSSCDNINLSTFLKNIIDK